MECLTRGGHEYQRCFTVKEQLSTTNEVFDYFQCAVCGSLQINPIPLDMGRDYPSDYYSLAVADEPIASLGGLKRFVRGARTDYDINHVTLVGWAIDKIAHKHFDLEWEWFRGHVSTRSHILDIGCVYGNLLRKMEWRGFSHFTSVDPIIAQTLKADGMQIVRG